MRIQVLQNTQDICIFQNPQPTNQEDPSSDHMLMQSPFQQIQDSLSCPGKTTEEAMHTCVVQIRKWRFVVAYK